MFCVFSILSFVEIYARALCCNNLKDVGMILFCRKCRHVVGHIDYLNGERLCRLNNVRAVRFEPLMLRQHNEKEVLLIGARDAVPKRQRIASVSDFELEPPSKKHKIDELLVMHVHLRYENAPLREDNEEHNILPDYESEYDSDLDEEESIVSLGSTDSVWSEDASWGRVGLPPRTPIESPPASCPTSPLFSDSVHDFLNHEIFVAFGTAEPSRKHCVLHIDISKPCY